MKKVLYVTNTPVPYRVRFFNLLAGECRLTVLYERALSSNRDRAWATSQRPAHQALYLKGLPVRGEFALSPGILPRVLGGYDHVIFGCFNSPAQQLAMQAMRLLGRPYFLSFDGEPFWAGASRKDRLKRRLASGAAGYLAAGRASARSLAPIAGGRPVVPYFFSPLTAAELAARSQEPPRPREEFILVVGQYFDYKGLDVALEAARRDASLRYKFVGMGSRTEEFRRTFHLDELPNVELIPFLQPDELAEEYRRAALLVLPSRQECWGLVINEAASFGLPIVSTWGSGAAVEFLEEDYPQYLAPPGDAAGLLAAIHRLLREEDRQAYGRFLRRRSGEYTLERSVQAHLRLLERSPGPRWEENG